MKRELDDLKKELVVEIKELAADIASSNSYVGLLANEIKFRSLQEKFINLKFLERKHYGLEIFESDRFVEAVDEPIPDIEDTAEDIDTAITLKDQNPAQEMAISVSVQQVNKEEIEATQEDKVENNMTVEEPSSVLQTADNNAFNKETNALDKENEFNTLESTSPLFKPEKTNIAEEPQAVIESAVEPNNIMPQSKAVPPIQLDFNDQLAFQFQLFDGDEESMDMVIRTLNAIQTLADSKKYLADLQHEMDWVNKDEYVERLEELVIKRFE